MTRQPSLPRPSGISPSLEAALDAFRSRRHDDAERLAREVLGADSANTVAAQVLGHTLLLLGRAADAIEPLRSVARDADDPALGTLLGKVLAAAGQRDGAIEHLRHETARRPPFPLAFLELGDLLGDLGRFDEAIAVFEHGLALTPDAVVLRVGLAQLHLAGNDRGEARRGFSAVRAAAPQRRDAIVGLARVMALDGEHASATDLFRQALELRPDDDATRIDLARSLLEMGDREGGEASLRTAVRASPELAGLALTALASASHGRFFLRPSAAARFLEADAG